MPKPPVIDKLGLVYIKDSKILMARNANKDIFYVPGGKREGSESDGQALTREIREELNVEILPETLKYYGTFEAQAHGKPEGVMIKMTCYVADFAGNPKPGAEIKDLAFYGYAQRSIVGPVCKLVFDDLKAKNMIL